MTVQEVKNLFYTCNDCKKTHLLSNVFDGTLPKNWTRVEQYSVSDGYMSPLNLENFGSINHYCEKCSEKREIRETFR